MRKNRLIALLLCAALALAASTAVLALELPARAEVRSGVDVSANDKASVDWSNISEGFIGVRYTGGKNVRIKVQITRNGGVTYTYDLNNAGIEETFPLVEGDGSYTVKVFENTSGTRYAQAFSTKLDMKLRSEFLPFLYPNQYVNYTEDSQTVKVAAEITGGVEKDIDKVGEVYRYVVKNISYDYNKINTLSSDYVPAVDEILEQKTGICFDYAAVMAAMLRSQGVPCKLIVGYAGTVYHAWVNVYIQGQGWIDKAIYFDGQNWKLMDPTFASTGHSSPAIVSYINDAANYTQRYAY
ncbi:MAG: transglutaminase-like domain-containing protein [Candidatus Heteroscillospira sp.]|jgi:hypothetical protein